MTDVSMQVRTIGDFYRRSLARAENFRRMADEERHSDFLRAHFRERAFEVEIKATCLAHCLIKFGDVELNQLNLEESRAAVAGMTCENRNPWAWGIKFIEEEIAGCAQD